MALARTLPRYTTEADPQMGDTAGAAALDAEQAALAQAQDPSAGSDALEQNLGNTVAVATALPIGTLTSPQSLCYATFDKAQACTLMLQADGPGTVITVRTSIAGRATFVRQFPISKTGHPRTVRLFGRMIDVTVQALFNAATVDVTGALITDQTDALGELWPTWVPGAGAGTPGLTASALLVPTNAVGTTPTQAGVLLGAQGSLQGNPTANASYWVMFFDSTSAPLAGAAPLVAIGPLVGGQPSSYSFDRSVRPDIDFTVGLWVALSSTGDTYTPITDGALVRADIDWGT
jgi:hypothetical protein